MGLASPTLTRASVRETLARDVKDKIRSVEFELDSLTYAINDAIDRAMTKLDEVENPEKTPREIAQEVMDRDLLDAQVVFTEICAHIPVQWRSDFYRAAGITAQDLA